MEKCFPFWTGHSVLTASCISLMSNQTKRRWQIQSRRSRVDKVFAGPTKISAHPNRRLTRAVVVRLCEAGRSERSNWRDKKEPLIGKNL